MGPAPAVIQPLTAGLKNGLTDYYSLDGDYTSRVNPAHNGALDGGRVLEMAASTQGTGGITFNMNKIQNADSLTLNSTGADPQYYFNLLPYAIDGSVYRYIHIRVKRLGGTGWDGTVFFQYGGSSAFTGTLYDNVADPGLADGQFHWVVHDMWNASAGGATWKTNQITACRFDFGMNAGDNFEIDAIYFSESATTPFTTPFYEPSRLGTQRAKFNNGNWIWLPNAVGQQGTQSFAAWVTGTGTVYSKGSDASGSNGWGIRLADDATHVQLDIVTTVPGAAAYSVGINFAAGIDLTIPRLYVFTFDNPTNTMQLSLNGAAPVVKTGVGNTIRGADNVYLGANHSTTGAFSGGRVGSIDEVGMWSRVLSAAEITDLYNNGAGRTYS